MIRKIGAAALLMGLLVVTGASAADTPQSVWIRAKCALCHAVDGSGNTVEGKRMKVPDLRTDAVQKKSDMELTVIIAQGHIKMPSFRGQLAKEHVPLLVAYIRSLKAKN